MTVDTLLTLSGGALASLTRELTGRAVTGGLTFRHVEAPSALGAYIRSGARLTLGRTVVASVIFEEEGSHALAALALVTVKALLTMRDLVASLALSCGVIEDVVEAVAAAGARAGAVRVAREVKFTDSVYWRRAPVAGETESRFVVHAGQARDLTGLNTDSVAESVAIDTSLRHAIVTRETVVRTTLTLTAGVHVISLTARSALHEVGGAAARAIT